MKNAPSKRHVRPLHRPSMKIRPWRKCTGDDGLVDRDRVIRWIMKHNPPSYVTDRGILECSPNAIEKVGRRVAVVVGEREYFPVCNSHPSVTPIAKPGVGFEHVACRNR